MPDFAVMLRGVSLLRFIVLLYPKDATVRVASRRIGEGVPSVASLSRIENLGRFLEWLLNQSIAGFSEQELRGYGFEIGGILQLPQQDVRNALGILVEADHFPVTGSGRNGPPILSDRYLGS